MSQEQIIEVGKALLPYLRDDLTATELGTASHDAVAALNRVYKIDSLKAELDRLQAEVARLREAASDLLPAAESMKKLGRAGPELYDAVNRAVALLASTAP